MTKELWMKKANFYMQSEYGLPVDHGCCTDDEFYTRFGDSGQVSAKEAVDGFAAKYDLFSRSECSGLLT